MRNKNNKQSSVVTDTKKQKRINVNTSDWFWLGRILVIASSAYAIYVILVGFSGEIVPVILIMPLAVYTALLLYRGR